MKQLLFATALIFVFGCTSEIKKKPMVITVDFKKRMFTMPQYDSVWTSDDIYVQDSSVNGYGFGHSVAEDTIVRLINFKPLVIIKDDGDTMRYWFSDTVRFNVCKPDTVIIYKTIQHADKVIIGGN